MAGPRQSESGFHEDFGRGDDAAGGSDRAFGVVFAVVCALVGAFGLWKGWWSAPWWLGAAAAFAAAAALAPRLLAPLNRAWTAFGLLLHAVMSPLVMGILFFLVVTPVGLLMRATGKDPLRLRTDPAAASYWIVRDPPGPAPETLRRQF